MRKNKIKSNSWCYNSTNKNFLTSLVDEFLHNCIWRQWSQLSTCCTTKNFSLYLLYDQDFVLFFFFFFGFSPDWSQLAVGRLSRSPHLTTVCVVDVSGNWYNVTSINLSFVIKSVMASNMFGYH